MTFLTIPRTAGVFSRSRVSWILRSPSPRTVARWVSLVPITLFFSVTRSLFEPGLDANLLDRPFARVRHAN